MGWPSAPARILMLSWLTWYLSIGVLWPTVLWLISYETNVPWGGEITPIGDCMCLSKDNFIMFPILTVWIWACHLPSLNLSFPCGKIRMKNINFQGLLGLKGIIYMRNQQTFFGKGCYSKCIGFCGHRTSATIVDLICFSGKAAIGNTKMNGCGSTLINFIYQNRQ